MSRPPVSKVTPLPTSVTFGASSRPQKKSTIRGASAAARPTAWMRGKLAARSSSPRDHADAGVEMLGELDRLLFERVGTEHVGGRVDEVAAERDRRGDALESDPRRPRRARRGCGCGAVIGLEAVEAVEREQEAERREIGVWRRVGEAVDAVGQRRCELARRRTDRASAPSLRRSRTRRPRARRLAREKLHPSRLSARSRNVRRRPRRPRRSSI